MIGSKKASQAEVYAFWSTNQKVNESSLNLSFGTKKNFSTFIKFWLLLKWMFSFYSTVKVGPQFCLNS